MHGCLGQGVPQSYPEAVKWYRLAADHGNAHAQFNLSNMYYDGRGVRLSAIKSCRSSTPRRTK